MFFNCVFLALCSTLDSLGIGITYGLKNTHILFSAKIILFISSFLVALFALLLGNCMAYLLPNNATNILGSFVLILIGRFYDFFLFQERKSKNREK